MMQVYFKGEHSCVYKMVTSCYNNLANYMRHSLLFRNEVNMALLHLLNERLVLHP